LPVLIRHVYGLDAVVSQMPLDFSLAGGTRLEPKNATILLARGKFTQKPNCDSPSLALAALAAF